MTGHPLGLVAVRAWWGSRRVGGGRGAGFGDRLARPLGLIAVRAWRGWGLLVVVSDRGLHG
ncbi:hypothetical protein KPATCC21470_6341 [Kitasatospora purpeofusca]